MQGKRQTPIPAPDWINKAPSEWPASARTFYRLLAELAEECLAEDAAKAEHPATGAA